MNIYIYLVGGFKPFEKYARQIGNPPQGPGMKIKNLWNHHLDMGVSKNNGTPKSSILIGFSIINHPFTPIFGNIHINMHDLFYPKHPHPPMDSWPPDAIGAAWTSAILGVSRIAGYTPVPNVGVILWGNPQISPKIVGSYGLSSLIQRWFQGHSKHMAAPFTHGIHVW